jgi:secreted PhoX family phosphatase
MNLSRRHFVQSAVAVSLGFAGLHRLLSTPGFASLASADTMLTKGFGPLVNDPNGILALPEGFQYHIISQHGDPMTDGFLVPGRPDGMAAFEGPDGLTVLVRNHENNPGDLLNGPWGRDRALFAKAPKELLYDAGNETILPCTGCTTNVVWNTKENKLVSQHLSVAGTARNCAGGPTPWNTWLTCEESVVRAGKEVTKDHGWVFEVPATTSGLAKAEPIIAMGRFNHEAVAVLPDGAVVYQTEDVRDGLIYRYIANVPGKLMAGGRLQALAIKERPALDTRNWEGQPIPMGATFETYWVDLEDVESPNDDLRYQGASKGAAIFARGEGMWYGNGAVYWACTNGGIKKQGQIWKYTPGANEGQTDEQAGRLELFVESPGSEVLTAADNLCVAPWGDVVIVEDHGSTCRIHGITPAGKVYTIGANMKEGAELAGVCFSPDGSTMFLNPQLAGITVAITGPWERISQS